MTKTTYVVAGNGASLAQPFEGRILGSDFMLRTNNFFFEPRSFLGPRVDLAVMGGDPRVAPFMFETLWQCRKTYDLRHWTSHNPAVVRAGKRRFAPRYKPLSFGPPAIAPQVQALIAKYDRKPMTGTYALLAACGLHMAAPPETRGGIILAGMDLYGTDTRYAYQSSKNQMALLGHDLNHRRLDSRLHDVDLDMAIMALLQAHTDGALLRTSSNSRLDHIMDLDPKRAGAPPECVPTHPPKDWAAWAGGYPIALLRMLRWGRALIRPS